jgi:hypothetical protein
MKTDNYEDEVDHLDEFDEEQFDLSTEISHQFIDEAILPLLEDFDYNNPHEDYISGVATYGLFTKLISMLICDGFTVEQLKETIDDFSVPGFDDSVH